MNVCPFIAQGLTLPISVTTSASTSAALPCVGESIRLVNDGANTCFVAITPKATTAVATLPNATFTATSTPILPGTDIVLGIQPDQIYNISAITRTSTTTLYAIVGAGQ